MIRDRLSPHLSPRRFFGRFVSLVKQPIFLFLTIWGHFWIFGLAGWFYHVESPVNAKLTGYFDALYWAIATVTTVGFGDITATTATGKVISILLMVFGSLFLWSYVGLLVSALVTPEIREMERELGKLEEQELKLERLATKLEGMVERIEKQR